MKKRKQTSQGTFGFAATESAASAESTPSLFYLTNETNLLDIVASGIVRPRALMSCYEPDLQELTQGTVMLFNGGVPFSSLAVVSQHDPNDFPVIMKFVPLEWQDKGLSLLMKNGEIRDGHLSDLPSECAGVLIRNVIPFFFLEKVYFRNEKEAQSFIGDCHTFENTRSDLLETAYPFDSIPDLGAIASPIQLKDALEDSNEERAQLSRLDPIGGVLAALLRMRNCYGQTNLERVLPEWVPDWPDGEAGGFDSGLVETLTAWIHDNDTSGKYPENTLFRLILELFAQTNRKKFASQSFLTMLEEKALQQLSPHMDVLQKRFSAIRGTIVHDEDPKKLFDETGSCVMRGLLLTLVDDVYRENRKSPIGCSPTDSDLLVAEIFRGALHGWTQLPVFLRGEKQAELAMGYAMARLSTQKAGCVKYPPKTFDWVDEEFLLSRVMQEVTKGLSSKASRGILRQVAQIRKTQKIEIKIQINGKRKGGDYDLKHGVQKLKNGDKLFFDLKMHW